MSTVPRSAIISFILLILLGWALGVFYGFLARALQPGWFTIATANTFAALIVWRSAGTLRVAAQKRALAFVPAAFIIIGSTAAALLSRLLIDGAPALHPDWDWRLAALLIWIPVVEEIIFRLGIGGMARRHLGLFWGAYTSALVFALAHGNGPVGVPIGPLLLGLCCEWLYTASGQLSAAVALHAACNASGWIFSILDERWLHWLQALYLKI